MIIPLDIIKKEILKYDIVITGVLHIGAHECEEIHVYSEIFDVDPNDIIWIDAWEKKVIENRKKGIANIYQAVITDKDDQDIVFNISNNGQSSSVLDFGTHTHDYPQIKFVDHISLKTITIDTFFERQQISPEKYNFLNMDIQGAELMALKGATHYFEHVKVIYLEVNYKEVYKNCGLLEDIDEFLLKYNFVRIKAYIFEEGWGDALYIRFD